jgi:hypothetical protein
MLREKQWLEVGAMQFDDDNNFGSIVIAVLEVELSLPEAKSRMKEKVFIDNKYRELCKQVTAGGNIDKGYTATDNILCWENRVYIPEGLQQRIMQSEHDTKVAGDFERERMLERIRQNFYLTNMERDIRKYCGECDMCLRTKSPRHAKHQLLQSQKGQQ